jgi:hypothetical protein
MSNQDANAGNQNGLPTYLGPVMSPFLDSLIMRLESLQKSLSQPSQRGETMSSVSSEGLDEFYGVHLSLFTIIHHSDHFCTSCSWFRCIPTIFVKWGY